MVLTVTPSPFEIDAERVLYSAQILLCVAYNERVDVFSFGFTLLEIAIGDCTYIKKYFRGQACVVSRAKGGLGWRPPVPNELAVSQPDLALLFGDCVKDDFNERPSFVEICERLETCKADSAGDEDDAEFPSSVSPTIVEVSRLCANPWTGKAGLKGRQSYLLICGPKT